MKQRMARINELLQQEIATFFEKELSDSNINLSVYQVITSPDLKIAKVYLTTLDQTYRPNGFFWRKNRRKLARYLANRLEFKYIPKLKFIWQDKDKLQRMETLFNQIDKELLC